MGRPKGKTPDDAWLEEFRAKLDERGAQTALANKLGLAPSTVSKIFNGGSGSVSTLLRISRELGIKAPPSTGTDELDERLLAAFAGVREALGDDGAEEVVGRFEDHAELLNFHRLRLRDSVFTVTVTPAKSAKWDEIMFNLFFDVWMFRVIRHRLTGHLDNDEEEIEEIRESFTEAHSKMDPGELKLWVLKQISELVE